MAEIVDIADFKQRKLAKAEAEWDQCMARAEKFQRDGKQKFAEEMLAKAKALRKVIDSLRGPVPKRTQYLTQMNTMHTPVSFNFEGLGVYLKKPPETP